jgi:hypothetical protein
MIATPVLPLSASDFSEIRANTPAADCTNRTQPVLSISRTVSPDLPIDANQISQIQEYGERRINARLQQFWQNSHACRSPADDELYT